MVHLLSEFGDGVVVAGNPAKIICKTEDYISRKKKELEDSPCFQESYIFKEGMSREQMDEMNRKMNNRVGYIV